MVMLKIVFPQNIGPITWSPESKEARKELVQALGKIISEGQVVVSHINPDIEHVWLNQQIWEADGSTTYNHNLRHLPILVYYHPTLTRSILYQLKKYLTAWVERYLLDPQEIIYIPCGIDIVV